MPSHLPPTEDSKCNQGRPISEFKISAEANIHMCLFLIIRLNKIVPPVSRLARAIWPFPLNYPTRKAISSGPSGCYTGVLYLGDVEQSGGDPSNLVLYRRPISSGLDLRRGIFTTTLRCWSMRQPSWNSIHAHVDITP